MSDRKVGSITKELIAAKKRIENPENWCVGSYQTGGKFCAVGALLMFEHDHEARTRLYVAASELYHTIPHAVNDYFGHPAVMRIYDHAIQRALSEGK